MTYAPQFEYVYILLNPWHLSKRRSQLQLLASECLEWIDNTFNRQPSTDFGRLRHRSCILAKLFKVVIFNLIQSSPSSAILATFSLRITSLLFFFLSKLLALDLPALWPQFRLSIEDMTLNIYFWAVILAILLARAPRAVYRLLGDQSDFEFVLLAIWLATE